MKHEFSNSDDIIDSRDIIKRIEELQDEMDNWQEDNELPDYLDTDTEKGNNQAVEKGWKDSDFEKWAEWDESDEGEELKILLSLQDDADGYSDWNHGATLIRDSYFVEYAKELCKDIGYISSDMPSLIENNINWQGVAEDLQADYTEADFDGVKYWIECN